MLLQFVNALSISIPALTSSSVLVRIDNISPGAAAASVAVTTSVAFLDQKTSSARTYMSLLASSDPSAIFGAAFNATQVDQSSIGLSTVAAAGKLAHLSLLCIRLLL